MPLFHQFLPSPVNDKRAGGFTISVELSLLDAHTGDTKSTWTVSDTIKSKSAWLEKGQAMITNSINERSDRYGLNVDFDVHRLRQAADRQDHGTPAPRKCS